MLCLYFVGVAFSILTVEVHRNIVMLASYDMKQRLTNIFLAVKHMLPTFVADCVKNY